jgi:hypothetical protein
MNVSPRANTPIAAMNPAAANRPADALPAARVMSHADAHRTHMRASARVRRTPASFLRITSCPITITAVFTAKVNPSVLVPIPPWPVANAG